jgi:hypothetical protein
MTNGRRMRGASHNDTQRPPSTSPCQVQRRQGRHQGAPKPDHMEYQTGQSSFPTSGPQFYSWELIRQTIQDSTVVKFRRSGSSSMGISSGASLPYRATNAWAVEAYADDVSTLSSFGGVVRTVASITNALPPRMVRT